MELPATMIQPKYRYGVNFFSFTTNSEIAVFPLKIYLSLNR